MHAATADGAWERFLSFWDTEGSEHFTEEECLRLPVYARVAGPSHAAIVRTLLEHLLIRAARPARSGAGRPAAGVRSYAFSAAWLERHVRLEERILFPLIEDALPECTSPWEPRGRLANG